MSTKTLKFNNAVWNYSPFQLARLNELESTPGFENFCTIDHELNERPGFVRKAGPVCFIYIIKGEMFCDRIGTRKVLQHVYAGPMKC